MATEQKTLKAKLQTGKKSRSAFKLPLIGHLPIAGQLKYLGVATGFALLVTAVAAYTNNREEGYRTGYVLQAANLELYANQLSNTATSALSGNSKSFDDLSAVTKAMSESARILDKGNADLPATSGKARAILDPALATIKKALADADSLQAGRAGLVTLNRAIDAISLADADFRQMNDQLAASVGPGLAGAFQLAIERIARDSAVLLGTQVDMDEMARLGIDTYMAETALAAMPAANPVVQRAAELFDPYRLSVEIVVGESRSFVDAKTALAEIDNGTNQLIKQSNELRNAYETSVLAIVTGWLAVVFGVLTVTLLLLIFKQYLEDSRQQAQRAEATNRQNQDAILRLMNELSDLADGDLTIRATVSEDITGAIADSINYAIEALRELVTTITAGAIQLDGATKQAQAAAAHMAKASAAQSRQISAASESVAEMAASIEEVSGNAERCSDVARHSVDIAHKGGDAVRRTIDGMNAIRETIQETSKRIKRLGESSQEIGNIVELINDIAEQTNILALNASIQASMAGEAGRGFAVVADEVQRLAERAANATKQIEVLVRTIQTDTNEAVVSMERSTTDVVGGALLAENAGAALEEIEQVSNQIASLVQNISASARQQAAVSGNISKNMQVLREISSQTADGSSATSASVSKLAALAAQLRKSVAGFRLADAGATTVVGSTSARLPALKEPVATPSDAGVPAAFAAAVEDAGRIRKARGFGT